MEISQRFEDRYRVRFDEADSSGALRPSGLLRYAQDLAWRHSEMAGFGREWYDEVGSFWLVRSVALAIEASVGYGEELSGVTEVVGWRRVWARRQTAFTAIDGAAIATVRTDWVLLSAAGRPMRIPEELTRLLAPGKLYRPQKVELGEPPVGARSAPATVRAADIDPLGHLNNAAYLDIVDEVIEGAAPMRPRSTTYRADYLRPAQRGTELAVTTWPTDGSAVACRMDTTDGAEVFRAVVA
jgi:acyl-CoA thioesterase FadM